MDTVESLREEVEALRRRVAELEETQSRERQSYRGLVEDQRELICRFLGDGALTFVNDAYCQYFEKRREDLIGRRFTPLIPDEDQPLLDNALSRLSRATPVVEVEHRVIAPGGEVRWLNWLDRALFGADGQIVEYQAVGLDVTDRKRAEEQAQRSEELARVVEEQNREMSTPLIPLADNVLAMPLIGRIDEKRARMVLETLLKGVVDTGAETVLLDVTGVTLLDSQVAEALVRTAKAVALLGAQAVLTGIQPHVAQTLVTMGLDVRGMITLRSLQEGIAWAMQGHASRAFHPRHGAVSSA